MPSRKRRLDLALLAVVGLLVNGLAARWLPLPGYTDAYYYYGGAEQLAQGRGLTEPYLWNYLAPRDPAHNAQHRWPGFLYWMPLASLVAAPFIAGVHALAPQAARADLFRGAQLAFIGLASALPLLSYVLASGLTGRRWPSWAAGLLTLFSPFYFVYWTATDGFALFGLLAAGSLALAARAVECPAWRFRLIFAAGVAAGLAHLTRADGVLVLGCLLIWWAVRHWRHAEISSAQRYLPLGVALAGYALVMAPWFLRNTVVIGAPLAPGAARTIWLTEYDQFFTYEPARLSAAAYFEMGWGAILSSKFWALAANLANLIGAQGSIIGLPLAVVGAWRLRRQPLIRLAILYGALLLVVMTFIFTFPGARGGYFHSGAALLPFIAVAAVVGLETLVDAAARRLRHWQPERSKPIFLALLISAYVLMSGFEFTQRVIGPTPSAAWSRRDAIYVEAGAWLLQQAGSQAVVAVNNPPGWSYHTGQPAIVIPAGDVDTLVQAMQAVSAEWLVLDANVPAGLVELYQSGGIDPRFEVAATFTDGVGPTVYVMRRLANA